MRDLVCLVGTARHLVEYAGPLTSRAAARIVEHEFWYSDDFEIVITDPEDGTCFRRRAGGKQFRVKKNV